MTKIFIYNFYQLLNTIQKRMHKTAKFVLASILLLVLSALLLTHTSRADLVTTSVTVGNSPPEFTAGPAENPASTTANPANVGSDVTFEATATDANAENYYFAVCKTNSITANNGAAPTCGGGNWCISSSTSSGSQATCSYTTLVGDSESSAWYGFVCDNNASASACSLSSQGTGDSGSPFEVNHRPGFTAISNDSPRNPGQDVTWTATASDTNTGDTVKLIVCKTAGITGDDCDGGASDRWCASGYEASNPSCSYSIPVPTVSGSNDAYVYIVDNHLFAADSAHQGSNVPFTVSNVSPVVSNVTLNSGADITLTEGTTTNAEITATVTDNNGCEDISTVTTNVYRAIAPGNGAVCDTAGEADDNNCYFEVSCSVVASGNTCTGSADTSADYECTAAIQYHADPTVTGSQYPDHEWYSTVVAVDGGAASHSAEVAVGVQMNTTIGYDVTDAINYGALSVGDSNDPLDKTTVITATGNVGLDQELSGTDMVDGANSIPVANQKYALTSSTAYASGTTLSGLATESLLNCPKTTIAASPSTKNTWWGLHIPIGTPSGNYSGTNTIVAILSNSTNW